MYDCYNFTKYKQKNQKDRHPEGKKIVSYKKTRNETETETDS